MEPSRYFSIEYEHGSSENFANQRKDFGFHFVGDPFIIALHEFSRDTLKYCYYRFYRLHL